MSKSLSSIGEFGLINLIDRQHIIFNQVVKGIGDDTAVVAVSKGSQLVWTTDMLVEGVHFKQAMGAKAIGHKSLACSLSDVAAMGAKAKYALVSVGGPASLRVDFIRQVYQGIKKLARSFNVSVVGGDTVKSRQFIINVSVIGEVKPNQWVGRKGAKKGDAVYVTGRLGRSFLSGHHLRFKPRLQESQYLTRFKPTSMIDISDGLAADLGHILKQSQCGALLFESRIPKRAKATTKQALYDGEDFELLFTLSKKRAERFDRAKHPFSFYRIGEIVSSKEGLSLIDHNNKKLRLKPKGFTHF